MRIWIKRICLILILAAALLLGAALAEDGTLRVYLSRAGDPTVLEFHVSGRYVLETDAPQNIPANTVVRATAGGGSVSVSFDGRTIVCGEKAVIKRSDTGKGSLKFTLPELSDSYRGDLILTARNGALTPVLSVYVEDYVRGVLCGASDDVPQEALKAQAIAARSYALRKKAAKSADAYDLSDFEGGYGYIGGMSASMRVTQAVEETRGKALFDRETPALCVATESNGGQTESSGNAWNLPLPYLTVRDDPYDRECADAAGKFAAIHIDGTDLNPSLRTCLADGMAARLAEWGLSTSYADISIVRIRAIDPVEPRFDAPSRLYTALRFTIDVRSANLSTGKPISCTVTADVPLHGGIEAWYDLSVSSEENELVEITQCQKSWFVTLRRNGSGVGMSLCGARVMSANHGMRCEDILNFYYPNTQLRTLNLENVSAASTEPLFVLPTLPPVENELSPTIGFNQQVPVDTLRAPENFDLVPIFTPESTDSSANADSDGISEASFGEFEDVDSFDDWDIVSDELLSEDDFEDGSAAWNDGDAEDSSVAWNDGDFEDGSAAWNDGDAEDGSAAWNDGDTEDGSVAWNDGDFEDGSAAWNDGDTGNSGASENSTVIVNVSAAENNGDVGTVYGYVNVKESSRLVLRGSASKDGEKLDHLHRGDRVRILGNDGKWALVETDEGKKGYVSANYLLNKAPAKEENPWEAFKASGGVTVRECSARARLNTRMRAKPDAKSDLVRKVSGGTKVKVLGCDDTWAYVTYKNKYGFIMKKYLRFSE